MSNGIVNDLKESVDDILGLRDDLGADLKQVHIVTRSWTGAEPGDGTVSEVKVRMLPTPRIVEFTSDLRLRENGAVKQGDILLKMISKQSYPLETDVDGFTGFTNVEKFYEVGNKLYRVISVTEKYVTWNVLLRPLASQERASAGKLEGVQPPYVSGNGADEI